MTDTVAGIIVTYNRRHLLIQSLNALLSQTRPLDIIIVVDNGSTDGTEQMLTQAGYLTNASVEYYPMAKNLGAAAGFSAGIEQGFRQGYDWLWVMDDDAMAAPDALEKLLDAADRRDCVYGTVPMSSDGRLCWEVESTGSRRAPYKWWHELPDILEVCTHPFLGFMISKQAIDRVGFPDPGYFIYGEDVDYSERIRKMGLAIKLVKNSKIDHPVHESYEMKVLGMTTKGYKIPAWKQYYNIRNRIVVAIRHRGIWLFTRTLPGSLVRLYGAMRREDRRLAHLWIFIAGTIDGVLGRMGKRHQKWHINY